jgi:hypothetical protein
MQKKAAEGMSRRKRERGQAGKGEQKKVGAGHTAF